MKVSRALKVRQVWTWGILAAAYLATWKHLYVRGQIPVDGNLLRMGYPNWLFSRGWMAPFQWPLWNPLRNMGEPFLADPQSMAAYPVSWLLSPFGNYHTYLCIWVLIHTALAAVFTAKLAKRWTGDGVAAWTAAVVISLNACFTSRIPLPNHFASAAYIPMAFYFLETESIVGLGISLAMQWLAGFPSYSVLTGVALFLWATINGRSRVRALAWGGLWAAGLAAVQWIPFVELLHESSRPLVLQAGYSEQFSQSVGQLAKMFLWPQWSWFAPQLNGDPAIVSFYVGLPVLALAIWGSVKGGLRERKLMMCLVAACGLSLGSALPGYHWFLPARLFRFPSNWLLLSAWCSALLCASGLSTLHDARWKVLLSILIVADLFAFAQPVRIAWMPATFLTEVPAAARDILASRTPGRLYYPDNVFTASVDASLKSLQDYVRIKEELHPSVGMAFGVREVESYQVLALRRARAYQDRLFREGHLSPLLKWAGVSTLMTLRQGAARLDENSLVTLKLKEFNPPMFIAEAGVAQKIVPTLYEPGRVRASVFVGRPATVVFSEVAYPGWQALLDEKPVSHGLFEDTFLTLPLPVGVHWVEFRYQPVSFRVGLALSIFTLSLGMFLFVRKRFPYGRK